MSIKVPIKVKYGQSIIEIPVNTGDKLYYDNAPAGLSGLNGETFTIINQIPLNPSNATKTAWKKHILTGCSKRGGLYDKSSGTMVFDANTWTVFCDNWQNYKEPLWVCNGYYALTEDEKNEFFTVRPKDLIIFAEIDDPVPTSTAEYQALKNKYADCGGEITGVEVYINYHPNGNPWRTNHIEIIKG